MRSTLAVLVLTLFVTGCAEQATQPSIHPDFAASTDGERVTIRDVHTSLRNDCTGELIELQGRTQYHWRIVSLPSGHFHITNNFSLHLKGQGTATGDEYNGSLMGNFTQTVLPGLVQTNEFQLRLIGRGKASNLMIHQVLHWTITPRGEFVVDHFEWSMKCSQLPEVNPPALSIESITRTVPGVGEVPVDLNAVAGMINVRLTLQANNNPIDRLDLFLDTDTADSVVASQGVPDTLVQLSFNTAGFSPSTGAAGFVNRLHRLRGRVFLRDQPGPAAEDSIQMTLANHDTASVSVVVQAGGQADDQQGQTWWTGSVMVVALPVIYSTPSPTVGQVTFEPSGGLTAKDVSTSPFSVVWEKGTAIGSGGSGGNGLPGVETANFVVTVSATVNSVPTGPLGTSASFRYDNNGPGAPQFLANPNLRQKGWINGTVGLTGVNTDSTDNDWLIDGVADAGVGGYARFLRVDGTSPATVTAANAAVASATPTLPAPSLNNNDYCAVTTARDLLGNESLLPAAGTACLAPPAGTFVATGTNHLRFGVDLASPNIAFSGGLGSNARLNGASVGGEFQVAVQDTGTVGNSGMLTGNALSGTVQVRSKSLTPPSALSCYVGLFVQGACRAVSVNFVPPFPLVPTTTVGVSDTVGYYTYTAFAQDAAGNRSAPVTRVIAFDQTANVPTLSGALFNEPLAGSTATFNALGSDNFDLWKVDYTLTYTGGFAGPLVYPTVVLNPFNSATLLNFNVPAGITVQGFVRQIEAVTGNGPLATGGIFSPSTLTGVVTDQANLASAPAVTLIPSAAVPLGPGFTAAPAAQLINSWTITAPAAALVSDNAGPAPPVNPQSIMINVEATGPTATFSAPFVRVDFYALVGGNLQQIGSTTDFFTLDDGSPFGRRDRYIFTWTPGTTVPLGPQTIYAVGVNATGAGLVTQANTNITTTNP